MVVGDRKAVIQGEMSSHCPGHLKQSDNSQSAQVTHWRDPRKVKGPLTVLYFLRLSSHGRSASHLS